MGKSRLSEVRQGVEAVLRTRAYKEACIKRYNHTWDHVQAYMDVQGSAFYERKVGDSFLCECHNHKPYEQLTHRQKERVRHVEVLSGFWETGAIPRPHYW